MKIKMTLELSDESLLKDLVKLLKPEDSETTLSEMDVDRVPQVGGISWPGEVSNIEPIHKVDWENQPKYTTESTFDYSGIEERLLKQTTPKAPAPNFSGCSEEDGPCDLVNEGENACISCTEGETSPSDCGCLDEILEDEPSWMKNILNQPGAVKKKRKKRKTKPIDTDIW